MMKQLDWRQVEKLINKAKENGLERVAAGLEDTDMSWKNIWHDGNFLHPAFQCFASVYDTPMVKFFYSDNKQEEFECFIYQDTSDEAHLKCPEWWGKKPFNMICPGCGKEVPLNDTYDIESEDRIASICSGCHEKIFISNPE